MKYFRASFAVGLALAGLVTSGCVRREVVYVPAPPPGGTAAGPVADVPPPSGEVPPGAKVEVVPDAPGPDYVWTPGYWSWRGGAWFWVGGVYVIRPHPHAIWVEGHWARRGRHYIWVRGHWR